MSQPAPNQGAIRKYQPGQSTDGKSSATLQRYDGKYYQGEDVDLNELGPRLKLARIAVDHSASKGRDHHPRLPNTGCPMPSNFGVPLNAMNRLQEGHQDEITPRSMVSAMLWDQVQLPEPDIAAVVNFAGWRLFEIDEKAFDGELQLNWRYKSAECNVDGSHVKLEYRELLMSMRQAEYVFIPYQFRYPQQKDSANGRTQGNWVLIVMRVEAIELGRTLYDRCVSDIAIIDPDPSRREERAGKIWNPLRLLLEYAHIRVDANLRLGLLDNAFQVKDIEPGWMTGHVCYQYTHELFRRLRCLLEAGLRGYYDASFWGPLEEGYHTELARKTMLAACANRVIEKSEHYGRLAIEFPGFASDRDAYNYRPANLDPRTGSEKDFDGSDDAMPAPRHKALDPDEAEKIGMWSLFLDAEQRHEGNWHYVRTMGEFPKREDCTRDEARYQFAVDSTPGV
ncbi:hypothetical protein PG996_010243 [Apiospora saccharicola]|uniref:Uncharacterized protein n=1 Tax=Apiospora saccharicola TaxID=335842 RepID=A0ABR1UN06_9PEZI